MAGTPGTVDAVMKVNDIAIALLTGGSDKPYALGLSAALAERDVAIDFIGSDELDCPAVRTIRKLTFLNLRGDQREDAPVIAKMARVLRYYGRLIRYVAGTSTPVLHILWNNRFEFFDRTVLMAYYRLAGKRVVLTAHNVNMAARNRSDTWVNRLSLRIQYGLCNHIFVHTDHMKRQLVRQFSVPADRVTVIPFGVNETIPTSAMTPAHARQNLGIDVDDRVLLFFGQIAPYKGLEYLIDAVGALASKKQRVRVIIAGKVKRGSEAYWDSVHRRITQLGLNDLVTQAVRFIPDAEVEPYFKAADAVVLPYLDIFQSGVPFLAFSFGLPVIATDVGSLREDITPETGLLCRPQDAADLARAIEDFFEGPLRRDPAGTAIRIRHLARERHSWDTVAQRTTAVYARVLRRRALEGTPALPSDDRQGAPACRE
jgi:glycosyltransferase involved in cell wall biosynthesis